MRSRRRRRPIERTVRPRKPARTVRTVRPRTLETAGPIRHVVLLMMENRAFDHMLGSLQKEIAEIDGVVTNGAPRMNTADGVPYPQQPGATGRVKPDPTHERPNVVHQLKNGNAGFVDDYIRSYPDTSPPQRQEIMAYHDAGTLPALHELARHFTVCDRWFSSVPGPTWPNRLFALSGTSLGRVKMPTSILDLNLHRYPQDTIFDRLREAKRSCRIYFGDFPLALLFEHERHPSAARHYRDFNDFPRGVAKNDLPDFTFIEPCYLWPDTDDDHPPHEIADGERLIATVYNMLRASALWKATLLVIAYDEHGGFYDHVEPGAAVPPDEHREEYTFDGYGVRVPAILVSPWVKRGVCHDTFDHTSLLRYLIELWSLGALGQRTASANSIGCAIVSTGGPRGDTPPEVPGARAAAHAAQAAPERLNQLQRAIVSFSQVLEEETLDTASRVRSRDMALLEGPEMQAKIAEGRARRFLRKRGAKVKLRRSRARI
jgi:phospholipase C